MLWIHFGLTIIIFFRQILKKKFARNRLRSQSTTHNFHLVYPIKIPLRSPDRCKKKPYIKCLTADILARLLNLYLYVVNESSLKIAWIIIKGLCFLINCQKYRSINQNQKNKLTITNDQETTVTPAEPSLFFH